MERNQKQILTGILFLILVSCLIAPAMATNKTIVIANPVSVTGYTHKFTVPYQTGMNVDFSDVRFYEAGGTTPLPYFNETIVNSTSAIMWILIPSASQTTITMMIGRAHV